MGARERMGDLDFNVMSLEDLMSRESFKYRVDNFNKLAYYLHYEKYVIVYIKKSGYYFVVDHDIAVMMENEKVSFYRNYNGYFKADLNKKLLDSKKYGTTKKIYIHRYVAINKSKDDRLKKACKVDVHHINRFREDNRYNSNLLIVDPTTHVTLHKILFRSEELYDLAVGFVRSNFDLGDEVSIFVDLKCKYFIKMSNDSRIELFAYEDSVTFDDNVYVKFI